jgi:FkbM family methyltransferase
MENSGRNLKPVPPLATFCAGICRSAPKWTKSRSIALRSFPGLFFDQSADYVVRLAGSNAKVRCNPRSMMEGSVLALNFYEEDESTFIERTVGQGATVLDIGANVGLHTCRFASLVGSTGRVFAFEPNPGVASRLRTNLELNRFDNVELLTCGLSDIAGEARLYVNDDTLANKNATLVADPENSATVSVPVELRRLDDCWERELGRGSVNFVKIDIEGFEFAALRSGEEMIRACAPVILAEFSQYFAELLGYSWKHVTEWFSDLGYQLHAIDGTPLRSDPGPRASFNYVASYRSI